MSCGEAAGRIEHEVLESLIASYAITEALRHSKQGCAFLFGLHGVIERSSLQTRFIPITSRTELTAAVQAGVGLGILGRPTSIPLGRP